MTEKPTWLKAHGAPWSVTREQVVYDNPWITLTEYQTIAPTGRPALYGKVTFKNRAIGIVPLHADGTITLVGQNRFPRGNYSWEIPEGGVKIIQAGSLFVGIYLIDGRYYAIEDRCSHDDGPLCEGVWEDDECIAVCPRHGSRFDITTGAPLTLPAFEPVATFPVLVEDGWVMVEVEG